MASQSDDNPRLKRRHVLATSLAGGLVLSADHKADAVSVGPKEKVQLSLAAFQGANDTETLVSALKLAAGRTVYVPNRGYAYNLEGPIEGMPVNLLFERGAVFKAQTENSYPLFLNCNPVILHGYGQIGQKNGYFGHKQTKRSATVFWDAGQFVDLLEVSNLLFEGGQITERAISCEDSASAPVSLNRLRIVGGVVARGFARSGIELGAKASGINPMWLVDEFSVQDMDTGRGTKRGLVLGSNQNRGETIRVSAFKADGLSGSGRNEVKGVLAYGDDVLFTQCTVKNVCNTGHDDAEALYIKARYGRMTFNTVINGGHSHDGALTIKGFGAPDHPQRAGFCEISYNTVVFDDPNYDAPAIGIQRSHCKAVGNILVDERRGRSGLKYDTAFAIGTATSGVSSIHIGGNTVTGFGSFAGNEALVSHWTDIVIIEGNTVSALKGGYFCNVRTDSRISKRQANFMPDSKVIELDQSAKYPGFWDPDIWCPGDKIEVTGTRSNDGSYTIEEWIGHGKISVREAINAEEGAKTSVYKMNAGVVRILNNTVSNGDIAYFVRTKGYLSRYEILEVSGNVVGGLQFGFRFDGNNGAAGLYENDNIFIGVGKSLYFLGQSPDLEARSNRNTSGRERLRRGRVQVMTSYITKDSVVRLFNHNRKGKPGALFLEERVPGVSFTIGSTSHSDNSEVYWEIV